MAKNGDRITCTARDSFDIIVSKTPDLSALGLVFDNEECGTYALPAFTNGALQYWLFFTTWWCWPNYQF